MRFLYPLLMIGVLVFVCILMFSSQGDADPRMTADRFLTNVQKGDYKATVQLFGGNTCRCPKKGGWVSYLVYASSQEPNFAFAMGHPFVFKNPVVTPVLKKEDGRHQSPLPWQKPEDVIVDLDLSFDQNRYMPLFLPLKMAYGIPMTKAEFDSFLDDPDKGCQHAFTLRLRPSLAPGTIARPEASKGIEYKPTDKAMEINRDESLSPEDKKRLLEKITFAARKESAAKSERSGAETKPRTEANSGAAKDDDEESDDTFVLKEIEDAIRETQGEEVAQYLHPKDAGPVKLADGSDMSIEEIARLLPRLQSAKLRLHIVRREKLRQWTVYHFGLMYPHMLMSDGRLLELKSHSAPSGELPAQPDAANSKKRADD